MWKPAFAFAAAAWFSSLSIAADLSATEARWLKGAWPVISFARQAELPLDVVVQPQPTLGAAPLGMAFVDGRCKLVLSMRGNPEAQATLDRIEPALLDAALELMAAHELGHCRRYLDGAWYRVPAGFTASVPPPELSPDLRSAFSEMKASRREEGYGDLVGLAWVRQHRPRLYPLLHAWLTHERSQDLVPGSHHDTLAWVALARDGSALGAASPSNAAALFGGATELWNVGLKLAD